MAFISPVMAATASPASEAQKASAKAGSHWLGCPGRFSSGPRSLRLKSRPAQHDFFEEDHTLSIYIDQIEQLVVLQKVDSEMIGLERRLSEKILQKL